MTARAAVRWDFFLTSFLSASFTFSNNFSTSTCNFLFLVGLWGQKVKNSFLLEKMWLEVVEKGCFFLLWRHSFWSWLAARGATCYSSGHLTAWGNKAVLSSAGKCAHSKHCLQPLREIIHFSRILCSWRRQRVFLLTWLLLLTLDS